MSKKMREEFEEWFIDNYCHGAGPVNNGSPVAMAAWRSWQASRAALVVELPDATGYPLAYHEAISDVEAALDDAGVSYK